MLTPTSGATELTAAVIAGMRAVEYTVVISWPAGAAAGWQDVSRYVESVTIDRTLTTDLPEGIRRSSGYAAATAQIVLAGANPADASQDMFWLLSPWSTTSPLYRQQREQVPVTIDIGFQTDAGTVTLRRFVGRTNKIRSSRGAGTVTISCIDLVELLRDKVTLPPVTASDAWQGQAGSILPSVIQRPGLNSQWVIDYVLRRSGVYASPAARANAVMLATLHGSLYPEIGSVVDPGQMAHFPDDLNSGVLPAFMTGPWGLAATGLARDGRTPNSFSNSRMDITFPATLIAHSSGSGIVFDQWVYRPSSTPTGTTPTVGQTLGSVVVAGLQSQVQVGVGSNTGGGWHPIAATAVVSGGVQAFSPVATSTQVLPAGQWSYVGIHMWWNSNTSLTVTFRVNGTSDSTTITVPACDAVYRNATVTLTTINSSAGASDMQIAPAASSTPTWLDGFVPGAVLDAGLNELTVMPIVGRVVAAAVITDIAAAELATMAGFDETGVFRFRNRSNRQSTAGAAVTASTSLLDVDWDEGTDRIRNSVTVPAHPYVIQPPGFVWVAPEVIIVPPGAPTVINAQFDSPVIRLATTVVYTPSGGTNTSCYRATRKIEGTGGEVKNLTFQVTQPAPDRAIITITNPNNATVYLANPVGYPSLAGVPSLNLWGTAVSDTATPLDQPTTDQAASPGTVAESTWAPSITVYGEQPLDLPDSVWRQSISDARSLADSVLADLAWQTPELVGLQIRADPRLQLADRIRVTDTDRIRVDDDHWLVGLHERLADGTGYVMSIDTRAVAPPGDWILGDPQRSVLGQTTILGGGM